MRRVLSILVLVLLGIGPAISVIPAEALSWTKVDESRLPACCRRGGKHHCAMPSERAQSGGETTIGANDACPFAPQAMAATAPTVAAVLFARDDAARFASALFVQLGAATFAVLSVRRSEPKRGPPVFQN